jgi:hypothetical protein
MDISELGTTIQFNNPTWVGSRFVENGPQLLWQKLPQNLKEIALQEVDKGNSILSILENRDGEIVALCFREGPLTEPVDKYSLQIHTAHEYGNYCYDGTNMTYEDIETGCFLIFDNPKYVD